MVTKKNSEESVVVKAAIPKTLKIQFKVLCVRKELDMSQVLGDLIQQWIQAGAPVPKFSVDLSNQESEDVKAYVSKSLKLEFKLLCTQKKIKMRSVVYGLIEEWLESNNPTAYGTSSRHRGD